MTFKLPSESWKERRRRAFTLPEYLITLALSVLLIGATLGSYMYGLRMVQFTQPKLSASDESRKVIALLTEDIRSAYKIKLGKRTSTAFTELGPFTRQEASAIRIHPSTNTNSFIIYFWDGTNQALRRTTDNSVGAIVANAVTNELIFTAEDWRGNPYTNNNAAIVVGVTLQFNQIQFPRTTVGPSNYYDFYQVRTKINKRAYL